MGIRIEPDGYDIVVWKLDEAAAPFVNSSTSGSAPSHAASDLATLSGTIQFQQPSPFAATGSTNTAIRFTASNSGSPRNFISGANTVEPQPPVTLSFWGFIRKYNNSGFVQHIVNKQTTIGVWSGGTFASWYMGQNTSTGSSTYYLTVNTATVADPIFTMPLNTWNHIGFTYDGVSKKAYLNGTLVSEVAVTGAIVYTSGNHGPWFVGAIPSGSGNPEESAVSLCDIRIANVVRDLAYFKNVYNSGATSGGLGVPFNNFYKLRAFDLGAPTPTPYYWNSQFTDFTDAPSPVYGPFGSIEIVESWSLLGPPATPINRSTAGIQETFDGLTWLLPITGVGTPQAAPCLPNSLVSVTMPGNIGNEYSVTLRFRGVVEQKTYSGGSNDGAFFQVGGSPAADAWNIYSLTISNPPQIYYLNRGTSGNFFVNSIDYTKTFTINGGATIELFADAVEGGEIRNQDGSGSNPISIAGITDPAQPYDGQFIKMTFISVTQL